jgi:hypothetical protein
MPYYLRLDPPVRPGDDGCGGSLPEFIPHQARDRLGAGPE